MRRDTHSCDHLAAADRVFPTTKAFTGNFYAAVSFAINIKPVIR